MIKHAVHNVSTKTTGSVQTEAVNNIWGFRAPSAVIAA